MGTFDAHPATGAVGDAATTKPVDPQVVGDPKQPRPRRPAGRVEASHGLKGTGVGFGAQVGGSLPAHDPSVEVAEQILDGPVIEPAEGLSVRACSDQQLPFERGLLQAVHEAKVPEPVQEFAARPWFDGVHSANLER